MYDNEVARTSQPVAVRSTHCHHKANKTVTYGSYESHQMECMNDPAGFSEPASLEDEEEDGLAMMVGHIKDAPTPLNSVVADSPFANMLIGEGLANQSSKFSLHSLLHGAVSLY
ncbi:unnamed protein product [Mesocestoides corti]|uniref:Elf-1_N domain-containing protein n=1 Tax=Mesocestoides corti TaxID=53468 RepID=A0A0R3UN09_MESCO|nr:unnamed protein product [Mesocestoides corti]